MHDFETTIAKQQFTHEMDAMHHQWLRRNTLGHAPQGNLRGSHGHLNTNLALKLGDVLGVGEVAGEIVVPRISTVHGVLKEQKHIAKFEGIKDSPSDFHHHTERSTGHKKIASKLHSERVFKKVMMGVEDDTFNPLLDNPNPADRPGTIERAMLRS